MTVATMWRHTSRGRVTSRAPIDALLNTTNPGQLIAISFLVLAARASVVNAADTLTTAADPSKNGSIAAAYVTAAIAATIGIGYLMLPVTRTVTGAAIGIAATDGVIIAIHTFAPDDIAMRTSLALFLLPSVIAAATMPTAIYRSQLAAATMTICILAVNISGHGLTGLHPTDILFGVGITVAGAMLIRRISNDTTTHLNSLQTLALTDTLTGLFNRRGLAGHYQQLRRRTKHHRTLGVLMVDIDYFKKVNDTFGHAVGDDVLRQVSNALVAAVGDNGIVARTGGEEFVACIDGSAQPVAQRLRDQVGQRSTPPVTVSIGIVDTDFASVTDDGQLWSVIDCADRALYRAKTTGRDRVCTEIFDPSRTVAAPNEPAPTVAAVDAQTLDSFNPNPSLPNWMLLILVALSIGWHMSAPTTTSDTVFGRLFITVLFFALLVAGALFATTRILDVPRWAIAVATSDIVIAIGVMDFQDEPARINGLLPLLITGLMVAQRMTRFTLLLHHLAVIAIAIGALAPTMTPSAMTVVAIQVGLIISIAELIFYLRHRNYQAVADLHRWSVTDPLTGLVNRRGLDLAFAALSTAQQLAVLAIDVDDFKSINDHHGHAAGDDALTRLADTLRTVTGPDAVVARLGGDEFAVLAPDEHPVTLATRIQNATALLPIPLSVSTGPALAPPHRMRSLATLLTQADEALTIAKKARHAQPHVLREGADAGSS